MEVTNRFKGLNLIDRVPKELCMDVCDIVHTRGSDQDHPQEKEMQKCKMVDEALQIAEKRKYTKGKEEKERYTHLNAEFQRIARRDKKAFLSDQCKEIEENNSMGKTRDLFILGIRKKIFYELQLFSRWRKRKSLLTYLLCIEYYKRNLTRWKIFWGESKRSLTMS